MAVRDRQDSLAVGDVINWPGHGGHETMLAGRSTREVGRLSPPTYRFHATNLGGHADERCHFALVAAQDRNLHLFQQPAGRVRPIARRPCTDGVEHYRDARRTLLDTGAAHPRLDARLAHLNDAHPEPAPRSHE